MRLKDIAWAAGLIEGEGYLGWYTALRNTKRLPEIAVRMTDRDVVERLAALFLQWQVYGPFQQSKQMRMRCPSCKPLWSAIVRGKKAIAWLLTIYPLLGLRRRAKAHALITQWRYT